MREKIDFSIVERLAPREDSFERVMARIDSIAAEKTVRFKFFSAFAAAASIAIVCASVLFSMLSTTNAENDFLPINNVASSELVSWMGSLGEGESDSYDVLDESLTISYMTWEEK